VGISTGVGTALDMAVHGKTSKDVLGRLTTSTALALGQNAIGDLSAARGLDEGSLGKTIAHAAVGGALGGTSGAIGGAVSEQMSAHLIDTKDAAGGAKIGLVAGTATMLTGGDVKDMSVASATAASAHEYNAGLHQEAQPILEEYLKDKSPAEQRGYIQALMRERQADAGVSPEDPKYTEIRSDVALGGLVDPQRLENVHQLMASNGMPDASKYTVSDGVSDYFARHDEGFTRAGQIFKIGAGYGGAVASTVTTTAGWAGPWAPFVGPAVTVASNALRVASAAYGLDAAKDFVLPYQHVEGANVLESYRNPVESYASRKGKAVGFDAAMIVSGYGAGQLIGGLAKTGPGQKLVANVVGGKAPVVKGGTTNVVQNGVGDGKVGEVSAGNTLQLKYKTGTNKQHFERKVEALQNLAKDGELKKTTVISRDKQLRDKYRREKMANAKKQFGQQNPEFVQQIKVRLKKSLDADHTHERQLGGADHPKNLRLLDRSVNRSIGAQVAPQIRGLSEGSIITDVVIIK
jgi:hypothetical protein